MWLPTADEHGSLPARVRVRKLVFTVVGVFVFAASLTIVFESMRAVMDVGGMCASGGPYEIRQECPDGAGLIVVGIFGGLIGTGLVAAGTFRGGPQLWTLAWPALFLALGWNFWVYGVDPPPPNDGPVWGWLVCAVLFFAMGGIPLLLVLRNARSTLWGRDPGSSSSGPTISSDGAAPRRDAPPPREPESPHRPHPDSTPPRQDRPPPPEDDLVSDLERLSALHRDGHLTDDEFARAKDARLTEEGA